jgi:hypothetical protein
LNCQGGHGEGEPEGKGFPSKAFAEENDSKKQIEGMDYRRRDKGLI